MARRDGRTPARPLDALPGTALPVVVIAGRPNVGKSTLFNRLSGRRTAIVSDVPGVTRDWKDAEAAMAGRTVRLLDTAGLETGAPDSVFGRTRVSSEQAIAEADVVLFCVDARAGITPSDEHFAAWLRRQGRPVVLVANKAEGQRGSVAALEAYRLGLGDPVAVSAEHNEGLVDLEDEVVRLLPPAPAPLPEAADEDEVESGEEGEAVRPDRPVRLAIVGRPNAGKSTLVNRLLGEERMITGPEPGLTRDAVRIRLSDADGEFELVDTAGLRRKARIEAELERMSVSATIEA
ncbi:MAG: ribosome biogenesis GTPase Der, partial [Gluconacetobacter diazotrophicus]|nr:ribosome biogenesis GTPase Der [Gluconacetobacter diazotrophicus]